MKLDIDENALKAVRTVIAQQILASIGTEHRDAVLTASIESALKDWSFRNSVEGAIAENAVKVVHDMLQEPHWQGRIHDAVEAGFNQFLSRLIDAVPKLLTEAIAGEGGTYQRAGAILKHMREDKP